jgi:hypothetical protein
LRIVLQILQIRQSIFRTFRNVVTTDFVVGDDKSHFMSAAASLVIAAGGGFMAELRVVGGTTPP